MAVWDRNSNRHPDRHRLAAWQTPVTLRLASRADMPALERLAGLDSRSLPPGPHLVAEREDRIEAALCLSSGELIADPFRRTAELCALLRVHAGERRARPRRWASADLLPQPRPVPA